jgi:Rrf2 family protein
MIRINRKTDYAIRVVLALAKRPPGARLSTDDIQKEMLIPRSYSARIVAELARLGVLETIPGPNGGLQLARRAEDITMLEVMAGIDGPIMLSECLCGPDICPLGSGCPVRLRIGGIQAMMLEELENTTFQDLAEDARRIPVQSAASEGQFLVV